MEPSSNGAIRRDNVYCGIDHVIPHDLGGTDDAANLWPQRWKQARMNDQVEVWLNKQVCAGRMSVSDAQRRIAKNGRLLYEEMRTH